METDLLSKLRLWDGVRVEYLKELYNANSSSIDFFDKLISICVNEQYLQNVATWLIKHHYDKGRTLPEFLAERLLAGCKNLKNWEAKLHVLQIIPHVTLSKKSIIIIDEFVRECLADNNKFVRAWAYNGFYVLTKYIPELKTELELICQRAMETESAAVKSRVRKIILALNKK